jgi:activator of HSP90 ATPase
MNTKEIKQTTTFEAEAQDVYEALMDGEKHAAFTGASASIDKNIKGKFSVYDGYCHGYNLELVKNEKIVQAWHFAEDGWPDDHFSICTFLLVQIGNKTKMTFTQTGVPEHKVAALTSGWKEYYWKPLKEFLNGED